MQGLDFKALFIGDKAENGDIYRELLLKLIDEHMGWRENYIPDDMKAISIHDKNSPDFLITKERLMEVMDDLGQRMRSGAVPWNSAGRYLGHMNSETLMPSLLAYSYAMLWNSNNVALESSMATSQMEAEVGEDFSKLMGFTDGWGHIVADGSLANLEGLWYARCIKSIPLAVSSVLPERVQGKTEWELLNMSVEDILAMLDGFTAEEVEEVKAASSRSGKNIQKLGKWIVPQTKHYSWLKALDICGVGLDQMVSIPVMQNYRMDVNALETAIRSLADQQIPVLGVVAVVGSTEEGAVDSVDRIVELRERLKKEGIYFHLHVDAAYGGYARALFIDEHDDFVDYDDMTAMFQRNQVFHYPVVISRDVYNGFKAMSAAETITIDPHKMGYVPYAAGGIAIKHKEMRDVISYFAAYVFEKSTVEAPDLLGAYILEGSKAGATAAAVWAAHQVLKLNITGYGKLIAASIEAASRFREFIGGLTFQIGEKTVEVSLLNHPDFNMVDWVFRVAGCTSLKEINDLNEAMYDYSSYMAGNLYANRFITSHTIFAQEDYGDSPLDFILQMGLSEDEWRIEKQIVLLRAAVMTPYMNDDKVFAYYSEAVRQSIQQKLEEILG